MGGTLQAQSEQLAAEPLGSSRGFAVSSDGSQSCFSEAQVVLLAKYLALIGTCLLLWRSRVLLPLKLFTVFLHELGHALAAWLVCARVHGIEVHADQGGLTRWSVRSDRIRCAQHVVLPAGYLGSAIWGAAILICCARPHTAEAMAYVLVFFLLLVLGYSLCGSSSGGKTTCTLSLLCVGMLVVIAGLLAMQHVSTWEYRSEALYDILLLVGTMNTLFATYDIWEDCVSRTVERSDAYKYADLLPCGSPRCIGLIWLLLSVALALGTLYFTLLLEPARPCVRSIASVSEEAWLQLLVPALLLAGALQFRICCSQTYNRGTRAAKLEIEPVDEESAEKQSTQGDFREDDGVAYLSTGKHAFGADTVAAPSLKPSISSDSSCTSASEED